MKEQKLESDLCARLPYGLKVSVAVKEDNGQETWLTGTLKAAIEDAVGEKLPKAVDVTETCADKALRDFELALYDDKLLSKAFDEAQEECDERDFNENVIAEQLSQKFNVKRI